MKELVGIFKVFFQFRRKTQQYPKLGVNRTMALVAEFERIRTIALLARTERLLQRRPANPTLKNCKRAFKELIEGYRKSSLKFLGKM